jgi:glutathione S-transferase
MKLILANKAYSSWSLRPWLALKMAGLAFEEQVIPLGTPDYAQAVTQGLLPAGKVPVLWDGASCIWDSLAIIEYAAEKVAGTPHALWPADPAQRAVARAVSAEMHSGFQALRSHLPMNVRKHYQGYELTPEAQADIARIHSLWAECRARFGANGAFLFGTFSAADAMFAPVVTRLQTYDVASPPELMAYREAILALAPMQQWYAAGKAEAWVMDKYEYAGGVGV